MVEVRDLGIGRLKKQLAEMGELQVQAGIDREKGGQQHPDSPTETVAQIAVWLEYGTKRQPARPFLRTGMDTNRDEMQEHLKRSVADLIDGRANSPRAALEGVASKVKELLLKHFDRARDWAAPLAPSTAAAKGHSQPLIDSATVREAIDAKVRKKK
jgi:hypothetical protein